MALSIGARPGMNNPGDLEVPGGNTYLYSDYGQSGVYASPNGALYPIFSSAQGGWNALVSWINDNVGSNDANSLTTPSEFASYYLNGSYGPLSSSSANPYAQNWLSTFTNALGIGPNTSFSSAGISSTQIANAVAQAEGTSGTFGSFGSVNTQSGNLLSPSIQNAINSGVGSFGIGAMALSQNPIGALGEIWNEVTTNPGQELQNVAPGIQQASGYGAQAIGSAVSAGVSSAIKPLTSWLNGLTANDTVTRVAVGVVAVLLLGAGIWFLAGSRPMNIQVSAPA